MLEILGCIFNNRDRYFHLTLMDDFVALPLADELPTFTNTQICRLFIKGHWNRVYARFVECKPKHMFDRFSLQHFIRFGKCYLVAFTVVPLIIQLI